MRFFRFLLLQTLACSSPLFAQDIAQSLLPPFQIAEVDFHLMSDTIHPPWSYISLTGERMKPGYPFLIPVDKNFRWLPVIGGVTGAGVATYFLIKDDKVECDFTATSQIIQTSCGLANGTVTISVAAEGQYEYVWSNGPVGNSLQNITAGNYTVTITRTGTECNLVLPVTVPNTNPSFNATITTQDADCGMQNGSAIVNVNPTGNYTFSWSTGASGQNQNNLAPGNYSVTVSAGGTCTEELSLIIGELPPSFEVTVTTTPSDCGQSNGTGTININPPGNYIVEWSPEITGHQVTELPAGAYTITVTWEGTQCSKTIMANVEELPPTFEISVTSTPSDCGQSNGTGNITVNPPGNYIVEWSPGISGEQVTNLSAGEYTITVTLEGTQCSKTIMANVEELPPTFEISVNTTPSDCGQSNGTGVININPSGNYIVEWSSGITGQQVTNLSAGAYTVTVTMEGTQCSKTIMADVGELSPAFTITSSTTPTACNDSTGTANITVEPPGAYTITWSNGLTGSQVNGLPAGDYQITVTITGTTCSNTATVVIGQTGVEFTGAISADTANCGVADGSATITIDPAGEYTYVWSDQQTGPVANQLPAGDYSVTVTDMNGCSSSFSATVREHPAEYLTIDNTMSGNCIGGGEINFTLTTPGIGPLVMQVVGPGGNGSFNLTEGSYSLSSFGAVPAGDYILTVVDQGIGAMCTEVVNVTIADNTPALLVNDDFYTTPGGQALTANALDNDTGLMPEMTMVSNVFGGMVVFNSSGEFTFTPDPGFSGESTFNYTVRDACGNTATALVTITVEEIICDFSLDVTTIPASCGFDDGSIAVEVIEPGTYSFMWNTGETDPVITNIPAGTYTVTVEEVNLGCSLVFSIDLGENPADYIDDIVVTQPDCGTEGEISFVASSPGMDPLIMSVDHPNGSDLFFINEGPVFLSDYISITPGQYTVEVNDPGAGPDCVESFTAEINQPPAMIEIAVEAVFPPSEPTAMDGSILIAVTVPGEFPYTVLLNGLPVSMVSENFFTISGLGVGHYTIQIIDAEGCASNIVEADVPFPGITFSFGTGIHNIIPISDPEHISPGQLWNSGLYTSLHYYIGNRSQELQFYFSFPDDRHSHHNIHSELFVIDHFSEIARTEWKKIQFKFQGGIGFTMLPGGQTDFAIDPQHWIVRGNAGYKLGKILQLKCSAELQGWKKMEKPYVDVSIRFNVGRFD